MSRLLESAGHGRFVYSLPTIYLSFVLFYILGSNLFLLILLPKLFQFCHCVDSVFPAIVGLFLVLSYFLM